MIRLGRRKKWYVLLIIAAVLLAGLVVRFVRDSASIAPTISKETTYLTEPLRSDGYPDYLAALNRRLSDGVTPANNSAVLFWKAMGPGPIHEKDRQTYFRMLGIAPLPESGDYFVASDDFPARWRREKNLTEYEPEADHRDPLLQQFDLVMTRPWSKAEFPAWADWLARNEKPLGLVVEASRRPRRFDPLLCTEAEMVMACRLPSALWYRDVARALVARAMLRIGEGRPDDAWADLLACHRLARLAGQGVTLIEPLVAITIDAAACPGDQAMLEHTKLTSVRIAAMREDLARLPPMPKIADVVDVGERCMCLDSIFVVRRQGIATLGSLGNLGNVGGGKGSAGPSADAAIDWNAILLMANSWYDRMVDAMRGPTRTQRSKALGEIDRDLAEEVAAAKGWKSVLSAAVNPREVRSQRIGMVFVTLFLPALSGGCEATDRSTMVIELNSLAFALAAYSADHGSYPARLGDLAPKYIAKVPKDIFNNDADLHYTRQNNGYLLYSVGSNGKDDGGKGREDAKQGEDWDDFVVRVPAKR